MVCVRVRCSLLSAGFSLTIAVLIRCHSEKRTICLINMIGHCCFFAEEEFPKIETFYLTLKGGVMRYFDVRFMEGARVFLGSLDSRTQQKVIYNIELAAKTNDSRLFKKLRGEIWEFRTLSGGRLIRLLAFWDKLAGPEALVVATNGFIKKTGKVPDREINRAKSLQRKYLELKG